MRTFRTDCAGTGLILPARCQPSRSCGFGKRSYSIYLWHYPLLLLMNPVANINDTPLVAVYLAGTSWWSPWPNAHIALSKRR